MYSNSFLTTVYQTLFWLLSANLQASFCPLKLRWAHITLNRLKDKLFCKPSPRCGSFSTFSCLPGKFQGPGGRIIHQAFFADINRKKAGRHRLFWRTCASFIFSIVRDKIRSGSSFLVWRSEVAQIVKNPNAIEETQVPSLGQKEPLEEEIATHFQPWGLQSMGSQKSWTWLSD